MDEIKNNFVVYTALFGDYDDLIDPKQDYEGCDFICFTDRKDLKSDIWEIHIVEKIDLPPNMMNRKYKILPHFYLNEYKYSMYIDSNIKIINNPLDLAYKYLNYHNFVMPNHFARNCIYIEADECVKQGKTTFAETRSQIKFYQSKGLPKGYGLGENNILLRFHNEERVKRIMSEWWHELNTYTNRDQLSLSYVLWKNNEIFHYMDESARSGNYFKIKLHKFEFRNKSKIHKYLLEILNNHPKLYTVINVTSRLKKAIYVNKKH